MRVAIIAPPWYSVPPSGYGGIGDPWFEAAHEDVYQQVLDRDGRAGRVPRP